MCNGILLCWKIRYYLVFNILSQSHGRHTLPNLEIELILEDSIAVKHGAPGLPVGPVPDVGVGDEVCDGREVSHVQVEDGGATEVPGMYCSTVPNFTVYSAHCRLYTVHSAHPSQ